MGWDILIHTMVFEKDGRTWYLDFTATFASGMSRDIRKA